MATFIQAITYVRDERTTGVRKNFAKAGENRNLMMVFGCDVGCAFFKIILDNKILRKLQKKIKTVFHPENSDVDVQIQL